jgi:hypothetical protein
LGKPSNGEVPFGLKTRTAVQVSFKPLTAELLTKLRKLSLLQPLTAELLMKLRRSSLLQPLTAKLLTELKRLLESPKLERPLVKLTLSLPELRTPSTGKLLMELRESNLKLWLRLLKERESSLKAPRSQ